jgi:hypothetical protein
VLLAAVPLPARQSEVLKYLHNSWLTRATPTQAIASKAVARRSLAEQQAHPPAHAGATGKLDEPSIAWPVGFSDSFGRFTA